MKVPFISAYEVDQSLIRFCLVSIDYSAYPEIVIRYEDVDLALHYGAMLRECIRHQSIARYYLKY